MKVEDGARLRIQWNAQDTPSCPHETLSVEKMGQDEGTGAYVCTACGELFKTGTLCEAN